MSSKKILTSGWFSLDAIVQRLVDDGYDVYTFYDSVVEGTTLIEVEGEGLSTGDKEFEHYMRLANFMVENISVGGRPIGSNEHSYPALANWGIGASWRRNHILETLKDFEDIEALIVHNDHDPMYGVMTLWARRLGIPVFCIYNGFSSNLHPRITGFLDYRMGAHYCIHGQYVLDYLNKREPVSDGIVVTGSPTFDRYYGQDVEVRPNTFLYNISTNYETAEDNDHYFAFPTAVHPWTFHFRPPQIDRWFLEAFSEYKHTINPEAKLMITLRPYHLLGYDVDYIKRVYDIDDVEVWTNDVKPFKELILEAEFFIGGISTTIQEAIITRTPAVFLCGTEPREDFFRGRHCYVESIMTKDSMVKALDLMVTNKEELKENCDKHAEFYNYKDDGKASDRVLAYIYDVIGAGDA